MNAIDCDQGSAEWLAERRGRVTASRVADAVCFLKNGNESAARAKYRMEIVAEILSGKCSDHYVSPWMERGTLLEPQARSSYELRYGVMVQEVGFVVHPNIERAGASPDGIVPKVKGLELKAPKIETHIDYMLNGGLPAEYEPQVMWGLACCPELAEWDFVSFCPELPPRHELFRLTVPRNEKRIAELESGVLLFLDDVDKTIEQMEKLNPELTQAQRVFGKQVAEAPEEFLTDADLPDWWRNRTQ